MRARRRRSWRDILARAEEAERSLLLTRFDAAQRGALPAALAERIDYEALSRTGIFGHGRGTCGGAAGPRSSPPEPRTSRSAARPPAPSPTTATPRRRIGDVGVAGLWRLMDRIDEIRAFPIVIVAAGMDAALPSVVGRARAGPGDRGADLHRLRRRQGEEPTAMAAMLASCAPGVTVVNIDNGYGAACAAPAGASATRAAGRVRSACEGRAQPPYARAGPRRARSSSAVGAGVTDRSSATSSGQPVAATTSSSATPGWVWVRTQLAAFRIGLEHAEIGDDRAGPRGRGRARALAPVAAGQVAGRGHELHLVDKAALRLAHDDEDPRRRAPRSPARRRRRAGAPSAPRNPRSRWC